MWDRLKRWWRKSPTPTPTPAATTMDLQWINDPRWPVPVLDLRPFTLGTISTSRDRRCAENALSFGNDDGLSFVSQQPASSTEVAADLRFPTDRYLADGALFLPTCMEEKWAIYLHGGRILFVRSWQRQVMATADVLVEDGMAHVRAIRGTLTPYDTDELMAPMVDYTLRSHALDEVWPTPLPLDAKADMRTTGVGLFSLFGCRAQFAVLKPLDNPRPTRPLRSLSLLHAAAARGDIHAMAAQLERGVPIDLIANDALTPLDWALAAQTDDAARWLLAHGCPVDARSAEGATPLMTVVQAADLARVRLLLDHGAAINAADLRGFTALHRAAEMGHEELVDLLLARGADPTCVANTRTPRSLAVLRGHASIAARLTAAGG